MTEIAVDLDNPYPGLRTFKEEDAQLFFGRKEQTDELLRRLDDQSFVAVVGLSGSGKSSLVRAGLIPALRRGSLTEGGAHWRIVTIRPGADPIGQLSASLDEVLGKTPLRLDTLRRSSFGLIRAAQEGRAPDQNLLIVVDQFEEIFRRPRQESSDFVRLLLTSVQEPQPEYRIYVVLTMRTDYIGDCVRFRDLPEALNESQYLVPRLTSEQRREAIEEPAKKFGGAIENTVLQQLMLDAGDDPDQLPILQHLLMRMWGLAAQKGCALRLTYDEYARAGGWQRAIDNHGCELLNAVPPSDLPIVKRIFQTVTELGGRDRDRRRLTHLTELIEVCGTAATEARIRNVVEHFSTPGANFLNSPDWQTSADPLVDITHESLIRQWTELNEWAREEAESGEWYRRIEDRLNTGGAHLTGLELESALSVKGRGYWNESWSARYASTRKQFSQVTAFLEESRKRRLAELRRVRRKERNARAEQRRAKARELAAYAVESLADDPELSILLAIQSVQTTVQSERSVTPVAEDVLHRSVLSSQIRRVLRGHEDSVLSVAMSPDGEHLASASRDGTAKIWNIADGTVVSTLLGHSSAVWGIAFSPDGNCIATASRDETAKIWDAKTGQELLTLSGHTGHVLSVAYGPDGRYLATSSDDSTARIWDVIGGKELLTLNCHVGSVLSVAFSPDGSRIATASDDNSARISDAVTGRELLTLRGHSNAVWCVVFSPDGKRLATASRDNTAKLWDAVDGRELLNLSGHSNAVFCVAFSLAGTRLATGGYDKTAKVWDTTTGRELLTLRGHRSSVLGVAFSPDGNRIATASGDDTVRLWDATGGCELPTLRGHSGSVLRACFSPDGQHLLSAGADRTVKTWRIGESDASLSILGHSGTVFDAVFDLQGKRIASASADATARIWDVASGRELLTLGGHDGPVLSVAFSPDGQHLATAGIDKNTRVWSLERGKELLALEGHSDSVYSVAFSPDGQRLATASRDKSVIIYDTVTWQSLMTILGHSDSVLNVSFSRDGRYLATASEDHSAMVWEVANGRPVLTLRAHSNAVWSVAFSPDGKRIATASADHTVKIWGSARGEEILTLRGHSNSVLSSMFSPDGRYLASASTDGTVQIYVMDIAELSALGRERATRAFTPAECQRYFQRLT